MFPENQTLTESFVFSSSLKEDIWHAQKDAKSHEWWYFDALSDDGRDAVAIAFFDNFIFSPRYNSKKQSAKVPAIVFSFYRNGKIVYRIIKEFAPEDFHGSQTEPFVQIGNCSVKFDTTPYGKGYLIEIKTSFQQNKLLEAKLEWLLIESDFVESEMGESAHHWNMVAPRADVTGHIKVTNAKGKVFDAIHFRGSGYHDHHSDKRYLPTTIESWHWGRAHFADATVAFLRYKEIGAEADVSKIYLVHNGELRQRNVKFEEQQHTRDLFGIKYPERMTFTTENGSRLRVKQTKLIDSSFFYLRFLSEINLALRDGKPRKTIGITEYLNPKALNYRWLDWLVDLRISRKTKQ